MSISQGARQNRIDDEAKRQAQQASNAISVLSKSVDEAIAFAAFMHDDPNDEFTQADKTKYSAKFGEEMAQLSAVMLKVNTLVQVNSGSVTPQDFLAGFEGDPVEYSKRFD